MTHDTTQAIEDLGVLRFITAGSVDDGKSTLIGRLLYDSRAILSDQLGALGRSRHKRVAGDAIDLALLTDGLEAEREQGITIDVAYRYFSTGRRKFIVADTPGHEQYTRNMVTGASTADAAIILVDATRVETVDAQARLLDQTKRHSTIVKLLGIEHVIVAINKMDLIAFSETRFNEIRSAYQELAAKLGLANTVFVPVSALLGDNIVEASERMPWYGGEPLLSLLEALPAATRGGAALRFPVQWVARQDGSQADDFRGYMGKIEGGAVALGDTLTVLPSGRSSQVVEIIAPVPGGTDAVSSAIAGQCVTLRLADDLDISRGDMLVAAGQPAPVAARKLEADLCWFDEEALSPQRKYLLKQTTQTVFARVARIHHTLDVHTLGEAHGAQTLAMNDIGRVSLTLQKPVVCDAYEVLPASGAFVLIDEVTHHTVAAGMIRAAD